MLLTLRTRLLALFALPAWLWAQSTDLPVKHVMLYKHGIGFFERFGTIGTGQEVRLDFKADDMNDVLKSLTVHDVSGNRISSIRYDSNETLAQRLMKFPFTLGSGQLLSNFLDSFKGARIELKLTDRVTNGVIVGARSVRAQNENTSVLHEQLTLLLDSGELATFDLGAVASMHFTEARLQSQLKQYLETISDARSRDRRRVYIDVPNHSTRQLQVAYVTPAAIWKSSYRLALKSTNPTLEGWAIVDNTTDEDWINVQLSVISGQPISFISQLDTPRYGRRDIAELPEDRAAGPVVYAGSVDTAGASGGVIGGTLGGVPGAPPPPPPPRAKQFVANQLLAPKTTSNAEQPQVAPAPYQEQARTSDKPLSVASGATLGELFEYNFSAPVTIKHSQSAMLPFLQDRITARKLLIYSESGSEHPVNAAEITNTTGKALDGGPVTVYDEGAYAGEALIETIKASDKRLIGYAVDYGTRITTDFGSSDEIVREVHAANGLFQVRYAEHRTTTYTIKNVDAKAKTLIVEKGGLEPDYTVLSPKPVERTASAYRFEVTVPASGSQTLKVEGERVREDTTGISDSTPDFLLTLVSNKRLTPVGQKQLQSLLAVRRRKVQLQNDLKAAVDEMRDLNNDSNRLRQNITSLNRVNGQEEQVRQYSSQLASNESQIVKLRDQQRSLTQQQSTLDAQIRNAVEALVF